MSRIGRMPIAIPKGVEVRADKESVKIKGPKGDLANRIPPGISVAVDGGEVRIMRSNDEPQQRAYHGLLRSLLANAVMGVTKGFTRELEIVGVGYKAELKGKTVLFSLGYSHPIEFPLPEGIEAKAERLTTKGSIQQYQTTLTVSGIDRQKLGQVCAEMHKLRKPDAYKGKGVRYADAQLKLKPGKTGK